MATKCFIPPLGAQTVVYTFTGGDDGGNPYGALLHVGDALYGTTSAGGLFGQGAIYKIVAKTGAMTTLYSFIDESDGASRRSALIVVDGILYGTTSVGATDNKGTVFSFSQ